MSVSNSSLWVSKLDVQCLAKIESLPMSPDRRKFSILELKSEFSGDDERDLRSVDTIVIHSMYNPLSKYPYNPAECKAILDHYEVSAHYLIYRTGVIWRLVQENKQAWHAGESQMPAPDGRSRVNSFSVGIELIANETDGITELQYHSLTLLIEDISKRLPITNIVGHSDIAPGRKTDPWGFDWKKFRGQLSRLINTDRFKMIGPRN